MPRPPRSSRLTLDKARTLARAGKTRAARAEVAKMAPGTVVIEVNRTKAIDTTGWPAKRRA